MTLSPRTHDRPTQQSAIDLWFDRRAILCTITMMRYSRLLSLLALSSLFETAHAADFPKVSIAEKDPATLAIGSISLAASPWCDGLPTYWLVGNNWEGTPESPYCKYANGTWIRSTKAVLQYQDVITQVTGARRIPRVDCVTLDVNKVCGLLLIEDKLWSLSSTIFLFAHRSIVWSTPSRLQLVVSSNFNASPSTAWFFIPNLISFILPYLNRMDCQTLHVRLIPR